MRCKWIALAFGVCALCPFVSFGQELTITVAPDKQMKLTDADLMKMARTMVSATEHNREHKYEGVLLRDLLTKAGAPLGKQLKGVNMTAYVQFTAKDNYSCVVSLAEVEPDFQANDILVADVENGKPLTAEQGPFRLIVPEDRKPARWIRMLERIDVHVPPSTAPDGPALPGQKQTLPVMPPPPKQD